MVNFVLTSALRESRFAFTLVSVHLIQTFAIVQARIGIAVIDVDLTIVPYPSDVTDALRGEQPVDAETIEVRTVRTEIDLVLASFSRES